MSLRRPLTGAEDRILTALKALATLPYDFPDTDKMYWTVGRVAHESGVSEKTTRQVLDRFVRAKMVQQTKLPGMGGPKGYRATI